MSNRTDNCAWMSSGFELRPIGAADGEVQQGPTTEVFLSKGSAGNSLVIDTCTPGNTAQPRLWMLQDAGTLKVLIMPDGEDCTHELHIKDGWVELVEHLSR